MVKGDIGLGEDWNRLIKDFEILAEYYQEGNNILSFGRDIRFRTELLAENLPDSGIFLDVGCGPGTMSIIAKQLRPQMEGVLLDPVKNMIMKAISSLGNDNFHYVIGIYEYLPFRQDSFSSCLAGFTIRDARNRPAAFEEIKRVLKRNAKFLMIDLGKPDSIIKRFMVNTYWRFIAPLRLRLALGERGKPYADIYLTYKHLPSNSTIIKELENIIGITDFKTKMFDGVIIATAMKSY